MRRWAKRPAEGRSRRPDADARRASAIGVAATIGRIRRATRAVRVDRQPDEPAPSEMSVRGWHESPAIRARRAPPRETGARGATHACRAEAASQRSRNGGTRARNVGHSRGRSASFRLKRLAGGAKTKRRRGFLRSGTAVEAKRMKNEA
ncbi:conserved hypothetical protein [Burkholderia pseudomallei MSHR346]|nr:conserved hypothetical protein [Burkholderia pseudomallei MSHR346]